MARITVHDIEGSPFVCFMRGSMGYVQDPSDPENDGRSKGYSYGYRSEKWPRLKFITRVWTLDDAATVQTWHADGLPCKTLEEALEIISRPPELSLLEFFVLQSLPDLPCDLYKVRNWVAGCYNPEPAYAHQRWGIVDTAISLMCDKQILTFDDDGLLIRK